MDTIIAPSTTNVTPLWSEIAAGAPPFSRPHVREYVRRPQPRSRVHAEPSAWSLSDAKRRVDCAVAALFLVFCWPLLLLAAILVRFRSPGPIIFRQKRVGLGGTMFTVYKFRTMDVAQGGPSMTKRGDPRITTFGRFLRKYKLDELPQFVNVLRGEMSLVGPRPRLPLHMDTVGMPFRPGLTGAATIAFRNEEAMLEKIPVDKLEEYNILRIIPLKTRLDWNYMSQATFISDVALLFRTAACCLSAQRSSVKIDI